MEEPLTTKRRLFAWIVEKRVPIICVFAVLTVVCLVMKQFVGVDYDMNDYLPDSAASTVALGTMKEEFDGGIPNMRVMMPVDGVAEAMDIKEKLLAIDGVEDVTWLDDAGTLSVPLEMQDSDLVESYYKDGYALYTVTVDAAARQQATADVREALGDDAALTGSAVSTAYATESTVSEIGVITVAGIAFVLLVLALTTTSWALPLLVLIGLGAAVAINGGTNLVFGQISFVTNAAGTVLQIAIALDFSVFLLHRFEECRGRNASVADDMVDALCKSSTAILSSGATVTIGFLALAVMQFKIGPDLGFALAKGMVISLVTVFAFVPALLVTCDGLVEKTRHRSFVHGIAGLARAVGASCVAVACVFVLLPVPAFLASTSKDVDYYYGSTHIFGSETRYGQDTAAIEEVFGQRDTYVLLVPRGNVVAERRLSDSLQAMPSVKSVVSYVDSASRLLPEGMLDTDTLSLLESDNYSRMVISVEAAYEGDATISLVDSIRDTAEAYYPGEYKLAGEGVSTADLRSTITEDKDLVDIIAVSAVLAVLLLATRSVSLPVILVFVIETSIWVNFSVPYFAGNSLFYLSYLIVSTVQLGVTVDYAILLCDRYLECRRDMGKKAAVRRTIEAVTVPVLTSGTVLTVVGLILSIVSSHGVLAMLGHFLGVGVLLSLFAVLFALPGFLYLLDPVIRKTTLKAHFVDPKAPDPSAAGETHASSASHASSAPPPAPLLSAESSSATR